MSKQENLTFSELNMGCKEALREHFHYACSTMEETADYLRNSFFTFEMIEVEEAKRRCMEESEDLWDCDTFEEYHALYILCGDTPDHHNSVWACIHGGNGEWLIDGWHRFHSYVEKGYSHIPLLTIQ